MLHCFTRDCDLQHVLESGNVLIQPRLNEFTFHVTLVLELGNIYLGLFLLTLEQVTIRG